MIAKHVKSVLINSEQSVSDSENTEFPSVISEYTIIVTNSKFLCLEEIADKVANKLSIN
mgnify:CR=1 FL=1